MGEVKTESLSYGNTRQVNTLNKRYGLTRLLRWFSEILRIDADMHVTFFPMLGP